MGRIKLEFVGVFARIGPSGQRVFSVAIGSSHDMAEQSSTIELIFSTDYMELRLSGLGKLSLDIW